MNTIRKTRQGFFTEGASKASYIEVLADVEKLNIVYRQIVALLMVRPHTLQEVAISLERQDSYAAARLNELREEYDVIFTDGEKKMNPMTNKPNTLWKLHPKFLEVKQMELFK